MELHKHLKNIKKNKATGPDDVKRELYRALGRSEMGQLNDRNRHKNKEIHCLVCDTDDKEDIYHFICYIVLHTKKREVKVYTQGVHLAVAH